MSYLLTPPPAQPLPCGEVESGEKDHDHSNQGRAMTRSQVRRVLTRAAKAWEGGSPHQAWEILAQSGLQGGWLTFQREALTAARKRYVSAMIEYGASQ